MKKLGFILLIIFSSSMLFSQKKISAKEAIEDIDFYFHAIDSLHPDMYWHTPKNEVDACIQELKERCKDSVIVNELVVWLKECNSFYDYHTGINFWGLDYYFKKNGKMVFPDVCMNDKGIFLKENNLKINSINEWTDKELAKEIEKRYGCDINKKYIYYKYSNDDYFQLLLLEKNIIPPFIVSVKTNAKNDSVFSLQGIDYSLLSKNRNVSVQALPPYQLVLYREDSIAIIRFNDCTLKQKGYPDLETFLRESFAEIERYGINNLFIDISKNEGGTTEACDMFLKHIYFPEPVFFEQTCKKKKYSAHGKMKMQTLSYPTKYKSKNNKGYKGNIFVYHSYFTASAAPFLAELLKINNRAILVGQELEASIPVYIQSHCFKLPNSGLEGKSSVKYFYKEKPKLLRNEKGELLPDIRYDYKENFNIDDCKAVLKMYQQYE